MYNLLIVSFNLRNLIICWYIINKLNILYPPSFLVPACLRSTISSIYIL